jgi:hypothetical protein
MGANFYMITKNKEQAQRYAPYSYELTDEPHFGYKIHIAKTSVGWLPLFQAHKDGISSVAEYKAAYDTGEFRIYDEYGCEYNWDAFDDRVLKHNGGVVGAKKPEKIEQNKYSQLYDKNIPDYYPISHIQGSPQSYKFINQFVNNYFVDSQGYEFDIQYFS